MSFGSVYGLVITDVTRGDENRTTRILLYSENEHLPSLSLCRWFAHCRTEVEPQDSETSPTIDNVVFSSPSTKQYDNMR